MAKITTNDLITHWIPRFGLAIIMVSTLPYKFMGHEESVALFTRLGAEPYGRIFTGVMELIAFILLILPGKTLYGVILAAGLMSGALFSHLTILGFEGRENAIGYLAIFALILCAAYLLPRRKELPIVGKFF